MRDVRFVCQLLVHMNMAMSVQLADLHTVLSPPDIVNVLHGNDVLIRDKNAHLMVSGMSNNLGNVISTWASKLIKGYNSTEKCCGRAHGIQCAGSSYMCLGKYLALQAAHLEKVSVGRERLAKLREAMETEGRNHMLYLTEVLKLVVDDVGPILASLVRRYAEEYNPKLLQLTGPGHCVVHYRVGDVSDYRERWPNSTINPRSLARVVSNFYPQPTTVEILGGGAGNHVNNDENKAKSLAMLKELEDSIKEMLPSARVSVNFTGSADQDWFKLATAPMSVISAGSFGATAAIAGLANQVRSPACSNILAPQRWDWREPPSVIRKGWQTYAFEIRSSHYLSEAVCNGLGVS